MADTKPNEDVVQQKTDETKKRNRINQSDIPYFTLEEALKVPLAIWNEYAGKPTTPVQVALALEISPTSTNWRYLAGAATAYGLTNGSYGSKEISITDNIGKRFVAPTVEGEDKSALVQAVLSPTLLNKFYTHYNNAKLPKDPIAQNVLIEWGVPKDKATQVLDLIKKNGEFTGILTNTKNGQFIILEDNKPIESEKNGQETPTVLFEDAYDIEEEQRELPDQLLNKLNIKKDNPKIDMASSTVLPAIPKVFVTHGKNKTMVEHLKELLIYGQFEPVISVERESTAIPVPDKVFNDMSQCQAGIIHIEGEQTLFDEEGKMHYIINGNVLIEIGAAVAYYGKKVILLCQKGITLPSNLQGLYRCEYEGEQLDYAATMKLLKTFNEIRK